MNRSCAECRRRLESGEYAEACTSCAWSDARLRSRDYTVAVASVPVDHEAFEPGEEELEMLSELASMVGEDGVEIVRRAAASIRRGSSRVYRAELNRLTDKFIRNLDPHV